MKSIITGKNHLNVENRPEDLTEQQWLEAYQAIKAKLLLPEFFFEK